eukprot:gi/632964517/ref/XP_007898435.1/ PREDICTED: uncharacterized protein LOC103183022 [Callorhinchus milii]
MLLLTVLPVLLLSVMSSAAPLTDCPTSPIDESLHNLFQPFGRWYTIAIASNSGETFNGLNSLLISVQDQNSICLLVDWDGTCTRILINHSNSSMAVSKDEDHAGFNVLAANEEYSVVHHYKHMKCSHDSYILFGKNMTVRPAVMENFQKHIDCAEIPDLMCYILPQQDGNCKVDDFVFRSKGEMDLKSETEMKKALLRRIPGN